MGGTIDSDHKTAPLKSNGERKIYKIMKNTPTPRQARREATKTWAVYKPRLRN